VVFNNGNTASGNPNSQQLAVHCSPSGSSTAATAHLNWGAPSRSATMSFRTSRHATSGGVPRSAHPATSFARTTSRGSGCAAPTGICMWPGRTIATASSAFSWRGRPTRRDVVPEQHRQRDEQPRPLRAGRCGLAHRRRAGPGRCELLPHRSHPEREHDADRRVRARANPTSRIDRRTTRWPADAIRQHRSSRARSRRCFPPPGGDQFGFLGDYSGLTISRGGEVHPIWADTRNVDPLAPANGIVNDEDVFTDNLGLPGRV
jgi:hypothetical protein